VLRYGAESCRGDARDTTAADARMFARNYLDLDLVSAVPCGTFVDGTSPASTNFLVIFAPDVHPHDLIHRRIASALTVALYQFSAIAGLLFYNLEHTNRTSRALHGHKLINHVVASLLVFTAAFCSYQLQQQNRKGGKEPTVVLSRHDKRC